MPPSAIRAADDPALTRLCADRAAAAAGGNGIGVLDYSARHNATLRLFAAAAAADPLPVYADLESARRLEEEQAQKFKRAKSHQEPSHIRT